MTKKNGIIIAISAVLLIALTATASAFITKNQIEEKRPAEQAKVVKKQAKKEEIVWNKPQQPQPQPQQPQARCDDGNIVGAAIGGAAGGLVGNQFGKGKGKDLATIGGVIVGGTAGHQMIPTRNVLCR